jgi:hypothetical protein
MTGMQFVGVPEVSVLVLPLSGAMPVSKCGRAGAAGAAGAVMLSVPQAASTDAATQARRNRAVFMGVPGL